MTWARRHGLLVGMAVRAWFGPEPTLYPVGSIDGDNRRVIRLPFGYEVERLYGSRLEEPWYTERTFRDEGWMIRDDLDGKIVLLIRWPHGSLLVRRP